MMKSLPKILYCLAQCFYWAAGCITVGFASAFLQASGVPAGVVGIMMSAATVIGFVLITLFGIVSDRRQGRNLSVLFAAAAISQLLLFFCFSGTMSAAAAGAAYVCYMALCQTLCVMLTKLYIDRVSSGALSGFSFSRGMGSLAFAFCALVMGGYLHSRAVEVPLRLALCLFAAMYICVMGIFRYGNDNVGTAKTDKVPGSGGLWGFIAANRMLLLVLLAMSVVSAGQKTLATFLVNVVYSAGGDGRSFGRVQAFMTLLEVPAMLLYPRLRKRYSEISLLRLALLACVLKLALFGLASGITMVYAGTVMHALSFGLFTPAAVEYVNNRVAISDSGKAQSLLTSIPVLLVFPLNYAAGAMIESGPVGTAVLALCLAAAAGSMLFIVLDKKLRA